MPVEAVDQEVHELLERPPLPRAVRRPERNEAPFSALLVSDAEEVLEPTLVEEGVALEVEHDVAPVRPREPSEAATLLRREELVAQLAGLALIDLELGLLTQCRERSLGDPRRPLV